MQLLLALLDRAGTPRTRTAHVDRSHTVGVPGTEWRFTREGVLLDCRPAPRGE